MENKFYGKNRVLTASHHTPHSVQIPSNCNSFLTFSQLRVLDLSTKGPQQSFLYAIAKYLRKN